MVHENSLLSYIEEKENGRIGKRQSEVLEFLRENKTATAREIMLSLGYDDMNKIRPRLTELKGYNLIHEVGKVKDEVTGKTVSIFSVK